MKQIVFLVLAATTTVHCAVPLLRGWSVPIQLPDDATTSNIQIIFVLPCTVITITEEIEVRLFIADKDWLCWYWIYIKTRSTIWIQPQLCATATFVSLSYGITLFRPCTERYSIESSGCLPRNFSKCDPRLMRCLNGGVAMSEGGLCWCDCPPIWQGALDCSVPVQVNRTMPVNTATCPPVDWCAVALPGGRNPCQNGGTCINQCTNFVCACIRPYSKDRLCSGFTCSANNTDLCPPGTRCNRGVNGRDEFYSCM